MEEFKNKKITIAPSIMCADQLNMGNSIQEMLDAGLTQIHYDVMDGNYVGNITLGFDLLKQLNRKYPTATTEVHMMVENVECCVELAIESNCKMAAFHLGACESPIRQLVKIKQEGIKAGIAINPAESVESLDYLKNYVDYALIMTVEPGFSGQKFIDTTLPKIKLAREILGEDKAIIVDGNITAVNAVKCIEMGADTLIAGTSSIYTGKGSLKETVKIFSEAVRQELEERGIVHVCFC